MNQQSLPSIQKSIALGALLLLAATASGCGVGLPTQPDVDSAVVNERGAVAAEAQTSDPIELNETGEPGGGAGSTVVPDAEIVIPTTGPRAGLGGWARGHQKEKWQNRH